MSAPVTAFISYAWESTAHRDWVRKLASRLRADGIDVKLDQWDAVLGDQLPLFMEREVREAEFVLLVCTPAYREKTDTRQSGVGYEGGIITGELFYSNDQRKFIPILRSGKWVDSSPSWARGKYYVDLSSDPYPESEYRKLLDTLSRLEPPRPMLGRPQVRNQPESPNTEPSTASGIDFSSITVQIDTPVKPGDESLEGKALDDILLALDSKMIKTELLERGTSHNSFPDNRPHIEYTWKTLAAAQALKEIVMPILEKHKAQAPNKFLFYLLADVVVCRHREFTNYKWPDDCIRLTL